MTPQISTPFAAVSMSLYPLHILCFMMLSSTKKKRGNKGNLVFGMFYCQKGGKGGTMSDDDRVDYRRLSGTEGT